MLRGRGASRAHCGSDGDGHNSLTAGHVAQFGGLVYDLVHCQGDEVAKHNIDNGARAGKRSTNAEADETRFCNGCVDDAIVAEFVVQTQEYFEYGACFANVFTHEKNCGVAAHFFGHGFFDGFAISHFTHRHVD